MSEMSAAQRLGRALRQQHQRPLRAPREGWHHSEPGLLCMDWQRGQSTAQLETVEVELRRVFTCSACGEVVGRWEDMEEYQHRAPCFGLVERWSPPAPVRPDTGHVFTYVQEQRVALPCLRCGGNHTETWHHEHAQGEP